MTDLATDTRELEGYMRDFSRHHLPLPRWREVMKTGGSAPEFYAALRDEGWIDIAVDWPAHEESLPLHRLVHLFFGLGNSLAPGPIRDNIILGGLLPPSILDAIRSGPAAEGHSPTLALVDTAMSQSWASSLGNVRYQAGALHGTANLVGFAADAEVFVALTSDGDHKQVCFVRSDDAAVEIDLAKPPEPTSRVSAVHFKNAFPIEVLAFRGDEESLIDQLRAWQRLFIACELTGIAEFMLSETVAYVGQRKQFSRHIGSFQAVQHMIADMLVATRSMRNLCEYIGDGAPSWSSAEFERNTRAVKAWTSASARKVCQSAIQMHGGIGFTQELDLHWYYKRALALRSWYGSENELYREIGAELLT